MRVDDRIKERFEQLVTLAELVKQELAEREAGTPWPNTRIMEWITRSQAAIQGAFGSGSDYYRNFSECASRSAKKNTRPTEWFPSAYGALRAAFADFTAGGLINIRELVEADVCGDFLEQAEHLATAGFYQAAAVVAGSILEDALRRLVVRHDVGLPTKATLSKMNDDLRKKSVYPQPVWREVSAKADLRNNVHDPAKWVDVTKPDVDAMISFVRRFLADYLS